MPRLILALVIGLSMIGEARSQARYEYKATPEESGPILIPCFVLDAFNYLCIETGEIFTDTALYGSPYKGGLYASPYDVAGWERTPAQSLPDMGLGTTRFRGGQPQVAKAATPRIILAHQKLARDGWVDRSYNKKGERCCDSGKDCFSLDPERVKPAPGGVNVTLDNGEVIFVPGNEILPSEDGKIWSCFWGERLRCLFMPYNGS